MPAQCRDFYFQGLVDMEFLCTAIAVPPAVLLQLSSAAVFLY